jgi:hypothetical protein
VELENLKLQMSKEDIKKFTDDQITLLINQEQIVNEDPGNDNSIIYKDEKVYDMKKRAVYGIQPIQTEF